MAERKTIYLDDALEAIRKLPNAGIHWYVSAEAVFDALLKLPSAEPEIKCIANVTLTDEQVKEAFEKAKCEILAAQSERKTGRWIKLYPRAYKCSECKTWWEESEDDEIKEFTYCPKCGKKMEVENEHR